jgi:hypothetical protein
MTMKQKPDTALTRRMTLTTAMCAGLEILPRNVFATSVIAPITFEALVASASFVVVAQVNGFLVSEMAALDDYKPPAEAKKPQQAALDITVKRVLAISPKPVGTIPRQGPALMFLGSDAEDRHLKKTPYSKLIGKDVILLLSGQIRTRSNLPSQPSIYRRTDGAEITDRNPIPLERIGDVLAAATSAGFTVPR